MLSGFDTSINTLLVALILLIPALFLLLVANQSPSVASPPKERDFDSALAEWAGRRGLYYIPQRSHFVKGIYRHRWFAIGSLNKEDALRIRMSVKNPRRHSLQIFVDWLDRSDVITFVDRFRVYSNPSGLSHNLFARGTLLQEALLLLPELRARLELFSDPSDPNHLDYLLLTDLTGADAIERVMASMHQFCDAYEQAVARLGAAGD